MECDHVACWYEGREGRTIGLGATEQSETERCYRRHLVPEVDVRAPFDEHDGAHNFLHCEVATASVQIAQRKISRGEEMAKHVKWFTVVGSNRGEPFERPARKTPPQHVTTQLKQHSSYRAHQQHAPFLSSSIISWLPRHRFGEWAQMRYGEQPKRRGSEVEISAARR